MRGRESMVEAGVVVEGCVYRRKQKMVYGCFARGRSLALVALHMRKSILRINITT